MTPWERGESYEPEPVSRQTRKMGFWHAIWPIIGLLVILSCFLWIGDLIIGKARGHPEGTPHREWLKQQWSVGDKNKGIAPMSCCDESDGYVLQDHEWRTMNGVYQVLILGVWRPVMYYQMRDTMVGGKNPFPNALAWWRKLEDGSIRIYCFSPGFVG